VGQLKQSVFVFATVASTAALLASASALRAQAPEAERFWAQWRGPEATGVSRTATPPLEWSETRNVRWKVEIPGRGSASPVVWGDRVFVLSAVPVGVAGDAQHAPRGAANPRGAHRYVVMALDRQTGRTVWERVAREEEPHEPAHGENGTWASSSAVTDGQSVFASFESRGLYAYDMNGTPLWQVDLGDKRMRNQFGEGSTPALHGNTLVVVWDHITGPSFVAALDKRTGKELWRAPRQEIDTWATPLVVEVNGRAQAIVPGMNRVRSYDLENGNVVWESDGLTMNPIPSPVFADGLAILMSGFQGNDLKAIRVADARGNIDGTPAVAWSMARDTPYVPSPVVYDNVLYFLKTNSGILSAFDARTGMPHYQVQRVDGLGEVFASPVAAAGRVYLTGRDGTTIVVRHGTTYEALARNSLDDGFDASPALVDGEILMRGYRYLYSIAEGAAPKAAQGQTQSPETAPPPPAQPPAGSESPAPPPAEPAAAADAGAKKNPLTGQADMIAEGQLLYRKLGCRTCHGSAGAGDLGPSIIDADWKFGSDDDVLFRLIKGEIPDQTMPKNFTTLTDDQVWRLVAFVRSLYKGDPAKITW
jgi:outer membrane protein assembly factor BamB/mono/diheme cytochrome c family protein